MTFSSRIYVKILSIISEKIEKLEVRDIIALMREKGVKQKDLQKATGYSREYISRVLNGKQPLTPLFEMQVMQFLGDDSVQKLKEENAKYERKVAKLEQEIEELISRIDSLDEENAETQKALNEANEIIRKLIQKDLDD